MNSIKNIIFIVIFFTSLSSDNMTILDAFAPDFQVNENALVSSSWQHNSSSSVLFETSR